MKFSKTVADPRNREARAGGNRLSCPCVFSFHGDVCYVLIYSNYLHEVHDYMVTRYLPCQSLVIHTIQLPLTTCINRPLDRFTCIITHSLVTSNDRESTHLVSSVRKVFGIFLNELYEAHPASNEIQNSLKKV